MTDRIQAMRVFVRIVDANSFSRAAESLELSRGAATTIVQNLEATLDTTLLVRTTRSLSLTTEGAGYYERCVQILADIDEMEASLREATDSLSGRLRIEMPSAIASAFVLPALHDFHVCYPRIDLSIGIGGRSLDLVGAAIDCSIQLGELPDSTFRARKIGTLEHVTCCSPDYLERHGMPRTLDDVTRHVAVNSPSPSRGSTLDFHFNVGGVATAVKVPGFIKVSDEQAYLTCGLRGLGLIQPARLTAQPYLDSGALCEVLPQWRPPVTSVSVVYVKSRRVPPRVRAFVDWVSELFTRTGQANEDIARVRQIMRGLHESY